MVSIVCKVFPWLWGKEISGFFMDGPFGVYSVVRFIGVRGTNRKEICERL